MIIFEVTRDRSEFTNETSALLWAQALAGDEWANVITWNVSPNLPGLKPDMVYRSCAMRKVFADGRVVGCNIHC